MTSWQLQVLGNVKLERDGQVVTPDRKSAAILSYLALNGPTSRSRLAGLLWPDALEATARNNLSQTLHRLRKLVGTSLIEGDDPLRLSPDLKVDAADLKTLVFSGEAEGALEVGELLSPFDFDDAPEFADWLLAEREALLESQQQALRGLIERSETSGRFA